ncbi:MULTISPECIES: hypothetical protein [Streptomyces]|uniref:Mucin-19 n=1 Tax=Streptomyces sviceus (strain ATCC 29083 / DSM 924 / JCM 4929 / NBRC 13980 / NCIMB 11184 / NRRL 5439 / UC 5370) TaxID=463191 RepID=B5HSF0_STRX2|nr:MULTISPECIES: hypothetical protein [Streptomyces]EDY55755.1 conserved hypothetical protein [Streptomyces sviceus ATCC 29083]MYT10822.1 hypothetical protein [Streptomyces sp. SID5470]
MDAQSYSTTLADLRTLRDQIKKTRAALAKQEADRDKLIIQLAAYEKAKAERIAPAAGLGVTDVVTLVPALAPDSLAVDNAPQPQRFEPSAVQATAESAPPPPQHATAPAMATASARSAPPPAPAEAAVSEPPAAHQAPRSLPSIPAGTSGDAWFSHASGLASTRPNFIQQARSTVFLDTGTGVLVHRDQTHYLDLASRSAADILTAVFHAIPEGVERIYITAGDPWHRESARYPYLRDAVAAWLSAPIPGWRTDTGRGRDRMAGHFVHARHPVGRYQREHGDSHVEIRSVGEWFDLDGDTPHTVRDAFVLLWQALRRHWSDAVLMGSPSQTGRDLWTRTIPTRGQHADGFPVLSEELRGLLHATAGQGRNELIIPPRVPEQLPGLVEYDRTFAYAKHTWKSPVGTPRRITAATFASWSQKEQMRALYGCGHWQVRVTVPANWNHVGLLPAPAPGDRAWHYPAEGDTTFTTWAGGPELHTALTNPIQPWKIEILDGILWEDGKPLDDWAKKLKETWTNLSAQAHFQGNPEQARAAHLASRAVRSILLYGIGSFAQRPRMVTGTTPRTLERDVPSDAEIIGFNDELITWQKPTGFARDPNAHPEWAAAIWSAARAALLTQRHRDDDTYAGALHTPPGTVIAFRTDALYLTQPHNWPHHHQPGDYLLRGHLDGPLTAPTTEEELLTLRDTGRAALITGQEA